MKNRLMQKTYSYWLLVPGVLIYCVIFIIPTISSFYFAMTRWNLRTAEWIGFDNYITFFSQPSTKNSIGNTFLYAGVTTVIKGVLGLVIAVWLCRKSTKAHGYIKTVFYFPAMLSTVVVGIIFSAILHPSNGIVNQVIMGLGGPKIQWLNDSGLAIWVVMFADIWKTIGINVLIYMSGIAAIPKDYYESSALDGANGWQQFKNITLPLLVPSINSAITLSLIGGMKNYELIWTMTEGGPGYASEVLGTVTYKLFARGNYGLATAGQVIIFLIVCVIVFPVNSWLSKKVVEM